MSIDFVRGELDAEKAIAKIASIWAEFSDSIWLEIYGGKEINAVAEAIADLAFAKKKPVRAVFNGTPIEAAWGPEKLYPHLVALDLVREYFRAREDHSAGAHVQNATHLGQAPTPIAPVAEPAPRCTACGDETDHVPNGMWCRGKK